MEAYLWKKGKSIFHMLSKRYYLLSGNCMYYYGSQSDIRPKGVVFLTGSIIEKIKDDDMELKGYYGFEIVHQDLCTGKCYCLCWFHAYSYVFSRLSLGDHHRHEKRVLYCRSEEERDKWVSALQHAAHVVPIEDDYVIGKELGRGRFSIVCECVHKVTKVHCAVKIIDKSTIEPEEKSLLRTEIAVLKLVNHPNIIRLEGLYESKQYIYIVMEMLKGASDSFFLVPSLISMYSFFGCLLLLFLLIGGELFERIVGRPRFSELEAAKLLRPLLEAVAYLHDLGIVHRDLKPENILCGEELEDLKIADFGLSKMILPKEKMDSACGTLSYVAPEVLTMQGYGKEADLWSVGVILFLLLCGKLPFDGEDHNEIIRSTIQADLKVNPTVWNKLTEDARNLITALLNKNPKYAFV
jgi:calcium/calmodulin-dependent protein kinase I